MTTDRECKYRQWTGKHTRVSQVDAVAVLLGGPATRAIIRDTTPRIPGGAFGAMQA